VNTAEHESSRHVAFCSEPIFVSRLSYTQ